MEKNFFEPSYLLSNSRPRAQKTVENKHLKSKEKKEGSQSSPSIGQLNIQSQPMNNNRKHQGKNKEDKKTPKMKKSRKAGQK